MTPVSPFAPVCPVCGFQPYDRQEDTCPNPECEKHWSRLIPDHRASEGERRAARLNLSRGVVRLSDEREKRRGPQVVSRETAERALEASVIMAAALKRIADGDFNAPAHASNIAAKALREAQEQLETA